MPALPHRRHTTTRTAAALLATALLAAACSLPIERPERPAIWDLGAAPPPAAPKTASASSGALGIARIRTTPALDSDAIHYRLLYVTDGDMQPLPYAHSRWSMNVPQLLGQRLTQLLAASRPVLDAGNGRMTTLDLRLELDEFAQHFSSPDASAGVLRLRATLFGGHPRRLLAQRAFHASHPAPTPDAAGGVQALRAATDAIAAELSAWLATHEASLPSQHLQYTAKPQV